MSRKTALVVSDRKRLQRDRKRVLERRIPLSVEVGLNVVCLWLVSSKSIGYPFSEEIALGGFPYAVLGLGGFFELGDFEIAPSDEERAVGLLDRIFKRKVVSPNVLVDGFERDCEAGARVEVDRNGGRAEAARKLQVPLLRAGPEAVDHCRVEREGEGRTS